MFDSQFDSSKFDIEEGNDSFSFEDAAAALSAHPTWRAAATMTGDERRSLFDRWVEKRREEAQEAKRRRLMDYLEACQWITVRTTWKEACDALYRIPEFEALSKYDQVDVFDTFMAKVEVRDVQSQSVGRLSFLLTHPTNFNLTGRLRSMSRTTRGVFLWGEHVAGLHAHPTHLSLTLTRSHNVHRSGPRRDPAAEGGSEPDQAARDVA